MNVLIHLAAPQNFRISILEAGIAHREVTMDKDIGERSTSTTFHGLLHSVFHLHAFRTEIWGSDVSMRNERLTKYSQNANLRLST